MQIKARIVAAGATALALALPSAVVGQVTTYTDRALFTTALGGSPFLVDFESFLANVSFASSPLDLGPFSLSGNGAVPPGRDQVNFNPGGLPASYGHSSVDIFVDGLTGSVTTTDMTFGTAVHGFFADFFAPGNGSQLDLNLLFDDATTADVLVPGTGAGVDEPFGFTSVKAVSRIRFNNSVNDGFSLDNVAGGVGGVATPEPATIGLVATGLVGVVAIRRRKRAA